MFMKDFTRSATAVTAPDLPTRPVTCGLLAGTLVETESGWRGVETLRRGDCVQTLDGGLAQVLAVDRRMARHDPSQALVALPGGVLSACSDALLLPGQHLAIDTLADPALPDAAFVLVPALALEGRMGCTRRPALRSAEVITPIFATAEILWANSGLLLHCPGIADSAQALPVDDVFPRLDIPAARALLARRAARLAGCLAG